MLRINLVIHQVIKILLVQEKIDSYVYFYFVAPGTYSPEKINLNKGPQYSLTGKGPAEKFIDTPGT